MYDICMACMLSVYVPYISGIALLAFCFICIFMNLIANAASVVAPAGASCHKDKCTNCEVWQALSLTLSLWISKVVLADDFVVVAEYFNLADSQ